MSKRPSGVPQPSDFAIERRQVPSAPEGGLLVRNLYLSVDPAQRGWAQAGTSYTARVEIGQTMQALAVAVVMTSASEQYEVGSFLYGFFGWQDYCATDYDAVIAKVDPDNGPLSLGVGLFGINGLTAYLGLHRKGRPEPGNVLLVSTAAGAVGSLVGQLGRLAGCRTIGLTGSDAKVKRCQERYGYHQAIDYKNPNFTALLADSTVDGFDCFFDNTGGAILDAGLRQMRPGGRIIQCGTTAVARWSPLPTGPRQERDILMRELCWQGFLVFNHRDHFPQTITALAALYNEGSLVSDQDETDVFEELPETLNQLFEGRNEGKRLVYIGGN